MKSLKDKSTKACSPIGESPLSSIENVDSSKQTTRNYLKES